MTNNPSSSGYGDNMSARKQEIRALADASASERQNWLKRSAFFHNEDLLYLKFLIPEGARVFELGAEPANSSPPSNRFGVGVHFSAGMIARPRRRILFSRSLSVTSRILLSFDL